MACSTLKYAFALKNMKISYCSTIRLPIEEATLKSYWLLQVVTQAISLNHMRHQEASKNSLPKKYHTLTSVMHCSI